MLDNLEYAQRASGFDPDRRPGLVTRLNGCGLYRRAAVASRRLFRPIAICMAAKNWNWRRACKPAAGHWRRIDFLAVDHYVPCRQAPIRLLAAAALRRATRWARARSIRASIGPAAFRLHHCATTGIRCLRPRRRLVVALDGRRGAVRERRRRGCWRSPRLAFFRSRSCRCAGARCATPSIRWRYGTPRLVLPARIFRPRKPPAQWMASTVVKDRWPLRAVS